MHTNPQRSNNLMITHRVVLVLSLLAACQAAAVAAEFTGVPVPVIGWVRNDPANSADGRLATRTNLGLAFNLAISPTGAIVFSSYRGIRQIGPDGRISTLRVWDNPGPIAFDGAGNLYFTGEKAIYRRTASGSESRIAGLGSLSPRDGLLAVNADISYVSAIAINSRGEVVFTDRSRNQVWRIDQGGFLRLVAGTGVPAGAFSGEGGPATSAQLFDPRSLAINSSGELLIADNTRLLKVLPDGTLQRLGSPINPFALTADSAGALYYFSQGKVQKRTADGTVITVAGTGLPGNPTNGCGSPTRSGIGDAKTARFSVVTSLALDRSGNLLVAEPNSGTLREITPSGEVRTIAGALPSFSGDGGAASAATVAGIRDLAVDTAGNLYVADTGNHRIRKVTRDGIVRTVVGDGGPTADMDYGCLAPDDRFLHSPEAVAVDSVGNIYVADTGKHRVMKLSTEGILTRFAGTGASGSVLSPGDASADTIALDSPHAVGVDRDGNVYVGDNARRILKIRPDAIVAGVIPRLRARSFSTDGDGNLYVTAGFTSYLIGAGGGLTRMAGLGAPPRIEITPTPQTEEPDNVPDLAWGSGFTRDSTGTFYNLVDGWLSLISAGCAVTRPANTGSFATYPEHLTATPEGEVLLSDRGSDVVWRLPPVKGFGDAPTPQFSLAAPVRNAASLLISTYDTTVFTGWHGTPVPVPARFITDPPIAPGEIVRITGQCLGPFDAAVAPPDDNLPFSLGGVRVFFDGAPAPLLSAQQGEILAITPFELVTGKDVQLRVEAGGVPIGQSLRTAAFQPGVFHFREPDGSATVLAANQDGTANSRVNPAAPGSPVWLYATGLGQTNPPSFDGQPARDLTPQYLRDVRVTIAGIPVAVLYTGPNVGFSGLAQIVVRVPENVPGLPAISGHLPVVVRIGDAPFQQAVQLWVK